MQGHATNKSGIANYYPTILFIVDRKNQRNIFRIFDLQDQTFNVINLSIRSQDTTFFE